ncbi:MAG TPA: rubrerythrin family protein [Candidatus Faecaligallichristensenella faecipullorum]|nr:rubrerythrin family protein [Candidatus Faecaligallichristensenella faecipullorum]
MEFKDSQTWANLMSAYSGESQACVKYQYYASKARADGFQQMANIFDETSRNEREHAKIWFKLLHDGMPETLSNLQDAAAGENFEWTQMYAEYAAKAREEGFERIATLFDMVGKIEAMHEARYRKLIGNIEDNKVFKSETSKKWICLNCGHVHEGTEPPEVCPVCAHPQAFFEIWDQNY